MNNLIKYGIAISLTVLFTGCFGSAKQAQLDLADTNHAAKSTKASNNNATSKASDEFPQINMVSYNKLVTPKW